MGAGASVSDRKFDAETVKGVAGAYWDAAKFDALKDADGCITAEQLLHAAVGAADCLSEETVRLLAGAEGFDQAFFDAHKDADGNLPSSKVVEAVERTSAFNAAMAKDGPLPDADVKAFCTQDGVFLKKGTEAQRDDVSIVVPAVTSRGSALQYASERLRDDERVVKIAVKNGGGTCLAYATARLQQEHALVELALEDLPSFSLKWEPVQVAAQIYGKDLRKLQTARLALRGDLEFMLEVVKMNGLALKLAMPFVRHDKATCLAAIEQNSQAVFYASELALSAAVTTGGGGDGDAAGASLDPDVLAAAQKSFAAHPPTPAAGLDPSTASFAELANNNAASNAAATAPSEKAAKEAALPPGASSSASSSLPSSSSSCAPVPRCWCPDARHVAKAVQRFPALAALAPPVEWLAECGARHLEEDKAEAAALAKRQSSLCLDKGSGGSVVKHASTKSSAQMSFVEEETKA